MAAGTSEVELIGIRTKAINVLISGAVPAAVLALVSPEAAEGFPEIAGFKIFERPRSRVAPTLTIQELIAAEAGRLVRV